MSDYINLKVKEIIKETDDTVTLHFKQPLFKKVKYKPGQFLTVIVPVNGKKERRSYSMSSAPVLDNHLAVTVKRVEDGRVSNYLNDHVKTGDSIELMQPMGTFTIEPDKNQSRHIVLFGAGSGITPLMSILKTILFFEPKSTVSLIYGNRNQSSIIFKDKLAEYKEKFGERFNLVNVLSRPESSWGGYSGRIDEPMAVNVLNRLPELPAESTEYYLCGPEGMMESVKAALKRRKVPVQKVYSESFVSTTTEEEVAEATSEIQTQQVAIVLDGEEHTITVPPSKSILDEGLDQGLDMPFSCQSGVCTACRGKCLSGKVKMVEGDGISADELAEGYVLLCVGHPLTNDVKIEIG